jgi:hypothetical protein
VDVCNRLAFFSGAATSLGQKVSQFETAAATKHWQGMNYKLPPSGVLRGKVRYFDANFELWAFFNVYKLWYFTHKS